jgi:RecB family exonuclease
VSLTLVTGPANAAKAGVVLDAFRAADDPLLVVPTAADVEPYQRELAASGAVFGSEVVTFSRLLGLIARRAGYRGRRLGFVARDRVVAATVAGARLRVLSASARTPGFARAAGRLFSELQQARVTPERFIAGLRAWSASDYAEDVGALYAAYVRRLEALGRVDPEGFAWGALDALRADPAVWDDRPVFLYGFDDLTAPQLSALETLVGPCGADVTLSLTWEDGRAAFASRAGLVGRLRELATSVVDLPARSEFAAPALHHLERRLFDGATARVAPNGAVRLLEAGGERAEAELIGAALLELVEAGAAPGDIAVLVRAGEQAPLLAQTLAAYGLPVERAERARLGETRLGAGLLAYGAAALGGTAAELLTWLRTPGKTPVPEDVDAIEQRLRRAGLATAAEAVGMLGDEALAANLATAGQADGPAAFLGALEAELDAIWTAPHRRRAAVLDADGLADAAVAREVRLVARELRQLAEAEPELVGAPRDVLAALAAVQVRLGTTSGAGILLADPLAVRARRFRVVVICGLQDGTLPRHPTPEPFLDDADRRALARASGIVLPLHEEAGSLDHERFLFYAAVSRAEEVLFLSFRASDEEGEPELRSPFVDDVADLFTEDLWTGRGRRLLAEVTWPPAQAPTPLELRRAQAAAAPVRVEAGPLPEPGPDLFAGHERESARGLEAYAACGVRWLVERVLKPARLDPDPEPMTRGSLAHSVLEETLRSLKAETGSAALTPASRDAAREHLRAAIAGVRRTRAGALAQAGLRALEVELGRWLDQECDHGPGYEPQWLEWGFDGLELAGVTVTGIVDRIDVGPAGAIVRDYKASKGFPQGTWATEGHMQAALYALAARELLGLDLAGALYQPLKGADLRPRGAVRAGEAATGLVGNDVLDADGWEALLVELRSEAEQAAARLRAGEIRPCPERCTPRGCAYPGICRAPTAAAPPEA